MNENDYEWFPRMIADGFGDDLYDWAVRKIVLDRAIKAWYKGYTHDIVFRHQSRVAR